MSAGALLCSDSPPKKSSGSQVGSTTAAATGDAKPSTTASGRLFAEFSCTRRDRDGTAAVDRRPPLPPPRRQTAGPARTVAAAEKSSPPPPPATTATASIEDVIGRLRLDEARRPSSATVTGDVGGVRRVPRMGTRLCGDVPTPSWLAVTAGEPPLPASVETPPNRLRPVDSTPDDDCVGAAPSPWQAVSASQGNVGVSAGADRRFGGVSRGTQTDDLPAAVGCELEAFRVCADVMYTNRANLRHTIAVQQRLFRQQLADRQAAAAGIQPPIADDRARPADTHDSRATSPTKPAGKLEWIVRKRSDGSRYVTRRPMRCRPESAARRSTTAWVGDAATTTTDDDEAEQPKTGRYWTRDERRRHVAERRQREAMKQLKRAAAACRCPTDRPQHALSAELAAINRHRQTALLSVATV